MSAAEECGVRCEESELCCVLVVMGVFLGKGEYIALFILSVD